MSFEKNINHILCESNCLEIIVIFEKRNNLKRLTYILSLLLVLVSCTKPENEPSNYVEVEGVKYELDVSHISNYKRRDTYGIVRNYYAILLYGKDYKIKYDSEGQWYSEGSTDIYLRINAQSINPNRLDAGFYKKVLAEDTIINFRYTIFSFSQPESRRYEIPHDTTGFPVYMAMNDNTLEIRAEELVLIDYDYSEGKQYEIKAKLNYKGRYHYNK